MIQTEEARNDGNAIQTDIELLVDMSSPDLLSNALDVLLHLAIIKAKYARVIHKEVDEAVNDDVA